MINWNEQKLITCGNEIVWFCDKKKNKKIINEYSIEETNEKYSWKYSNSCLFRVSNWNRKEKNWFSLLMYEFNESCSSSLRLSNNYKHSTGLFRIDTALSMPLNAGIRERVWKRERERKRERARERELSEKSYTNQWMSCALDSFKNFMKEWNE